MNDNEASLIKSILWDLLEAVEDLSEQAGQQPNEVWVRAVSEKIDLIGEYGRR